MGSQALSGVILRNMGLPERRGGWSEAAKVGDGLANKKQGGEGRGWAAEIDMEKPWEKMGTLLNHKGSFGEQWEEAERSPVHRDTGEA